MVVDAVEVPVHVEYLPTVGGGAVGTCPLHALDLQRVAAVTKGT